MADGKKQFLSEERILKDLNHIKHARQEARTVGPLLLLLPICIVLMVMKQMEAAFLWIGLILILICGAMRITKVRHRKVLPEDIVYDTDICTDKKRDFDSETCSYDEFLIFRKAGQIDPCYVWTETYLAYEETDVGDHFYTVALRDHPKIKLFYSCKAWQLSGSDADSASAELSD